MVALIRSLVNASWDILKALFFRPGADTNENRRRVFLGVSLLVVVPVLVGFGLEDILAGRSLAAVLDVLAATFLVACVVLLRRVPKGLNVFRAGVGFMSAFLLYFMWVGDNGGSSILWLFSLPPATLFLLGKREGLLWVGGGFAVILAMLFFPEWTGAQAFDRHTAVRFAFSYLVVGVISYALESLRDYYDRSLVAEHNRLKKALAEVNTLSGLLPICCECKQIRDDRGYWSKIESYISAHSDAEFSHGICPDCAHKLYPDIFPEPTSRHREDLWPRHL